MKVSLFGQRGGVRAYVGIRIFWYPCDHNLIKYTFLGITKPQFWAKCVVKVPIEETKKCANASPLRLDIDICIKHKKRRKQEVD